MIKFIVAWVFADIYKGALPKRRMSQVRIISIHQRLSNIINSTEDGASLITKQGAVKKQGVFLSTSRPHKLNGLRVFWKLYLNLFSRK